MAGRFVIEDEDSTTTPEPVKSVGRFIIEDDAAPETPSLPASVPMLPAHHPPSRQMQMQPAHTTTGAPHTSTVTPTTPRRIFQTKPTDTRTFMEYDPSAPGMKQQLEPVANIVRHPLSAALEASMGVAKGVTLGIMSRQVEKAREAMPGAGLTPSRLAEGAGEFAGIIAPWEGIASAVGATFGLVGRAGRIATQAATGGVVGATLAANEGRDDVPEAATEGALIAGGLTGLTEIPGAVRDSDWFRMLTVKERGLVVQTMDEIAAGLKKNGMTDGQVQAKMARLDPETFQAELKKRMGAEATPATSGPSGTPQEATNAPPPPQFQRAPMGATPPVRGSLQIESKPAVADVPVAPEAPADTPADSGIISGIESRRAASKRWVIEDEPAAQGEPSGPVQNNASGQTDVSLEAVSEQKSRTKKKIKTVIVDTRSGKERPAIGPRPEDNAINPFDAVVRVHPDGRREVINQGAKAKPLPAKQEVKDVRGKQATSTPQLDASPPKKPAPPPTADETPATAPRPVLRPAILDGNDTIIGQPGSTHPEILDANPDISEKHQKGFVADDGEFMTRDEAKAWLKENDPATYEAWKDESDTGELHSQDLNAASNEVAKQEDTPKPTGPPAVTIEQAGNALKNSGFTDEEVEAVKGHLKQVDDYGKELLRKASPDDPRLNEEPVFLKQEIQEAIDTVVKRGADKPELPGPTTSTPSTTKPLRMDGTTRPEKSEVPTPTIHPRALEKFNAAYETKDAKALKDILHLENRALRAEFERKAGVKLPKTVRGTDAAVDEFVGSPRDGYGTGKNASDKSKPVEKTPTLKAAHKSPQAWSQVARIKDGVISITGKLNTRPHELYPDTPDHSFTIPLEEWEKTAKNYNPAYAQMQLLEQYSPLDKLVAAHDLIRNSQHMAIRKALKQTETTTAEQSSPTPTKKPAEPIKGRDSLPFELEAQIDGVLDPRGYLLRLLREYGDAGGVTIEKPEEGGYDYYTLSVENSLTEPDTYIEMAEAEGLRLEDSIYGDDKTTLVFEYPKEPVKSDILKSEEVSKDATPSAAEQTPRPVEDDRAGAEIEEPDDVPATEARQEAPTVPERPGRVDDGVFPRSVQPSEIGDPRTEGASRSPGNSPTVGDGEERGMERRPVDVAGVPDYRIQPGDLERTGGWKRVAENNLDILELVKKLETENRPATPEEQALLVKFTGWGAGEIRNNLFPGVAKYGHLNMYQVKPEWKPLVERVQELFTPEELKTATRSTQYAHYTSEAVVRSIWKAVQRFGFPSGRIFEPGMGTGNFPGLMPDAIYHASKYTGIEYDQLTGKIAKALYPNQNIIVGDFVKERFPDNFFDLAIGNPPFSQTKILDDPAYKKHRFALHDYFFAKSIDKVRPGGILTFVTSRYTMDKLNDKGRAYLADRADLIGAIRLPQTAFKQNAGTEVVTDVLFLRKREAGEVEAGEPWRGVQEIQTAKGPAMISEYFANHPEMVLGEHSLEGSMYGPDQYTVMPMEGDIEEHFAAAVENLPKNIYSISKRPPAEQKNLVFERDFNPKNRKEGGLYLSDDGKVMSVESGSGVPVEAQYPKTTPKEMKWLESYTALRDAVKVAQYDQLTDGDWQKSLAALNKAYDAFVKKHGRISEFSVYERKQVDDDGNEQVIEYRRYKNEKLLRYDVESPLVEALERITEDGEVVKSALLLDRTIKKPARREVKTIPDMLAVSLDETGRLDLDHIAGMAKLTREETIDALGELIYENPSGTWELNDEYLSGDVVKKLDEAEQAARNDERYRRNVEALVKVQPAPLTAQNTTVQLGMSWIPKEVVEDFADEILGAPMRIEYNPAVNHWRTENAVASDTGYSRRGRKAATAQGLRGDSDWGTSDRGPNEILNSVLNNMTLKVSRTESLPGGGKKTYTDDAATAAVNEKAKQMRQRFSTWIWEDAERAGTLLDLYNKKYNNIAPRRFNGDHLTLPGVSLRFKPHGHQKRAVWRIIQSGNTYLAHAVGSGKTFEMIASGMEMKRLGLIKKPLYVVPTHMLQQFANEFMEFYPLANIMVADEENFHTTNRRRFMAQAALNDPDAVVITHPSLAKLSMKAENVQQVKNEFIQAMKDAIDDLDDDTDKFLIRRTEQRIEQAERRFDSMVGSGKDGALTFEELGADFMFVDEAHEFRKLDFTTNRQVKGIDPNGSMKALDLYIKTRWLESQNPGRSHVFASGTPITNTLGELYTIMRFFIEKEMEEDGIHHFDAWATMFGQVAPGFERNAAGRYEIVERFAKFVNIPELMRRVRTFMDVLTSSQLSAFVKRPEIKGGKPNIVVTPQLPELKNYMANVLEPRIATSKAWKPSKDEPGNPDPIINIITDGRLASIDMRFVQSVPNNPDSKLNKLADGIIESYNNAKGIQYAEDQIKGGGQIVFFNLGFGQAVSQNRGFDARSWVNKRLKDAGIPANEVAWIDDFDTAPKKEAMMKEMRQGKKKILIGSAKKMGTGMNVQRRLLDFHYLDPPWYPADLEQPQGRIIRQGNLHAAMDMPVGLNWYATESSYDSTMWQMVSRKSQFIEQALMGDESVRSLEDISEANQYEIAAALAAGDDRVIQLAGLNAEVVRLSRLQEAHAQEQYNLRGKKNNIEWEISYKEKRAKALRIASEKVGGYVSKVTAKIGNKELTERKDIGAALIPAYNKAVADLSGSIVEKGSKTIAVIDGKYDVMAEVTREGKRVSVDDGKVSDRFKANLVLSITDKVEPDIVTNELYLDQDTDPVGLVTKITNALNRVSLDLSGTERSISDAEDELKQVTKRLGAPFEHSQELNEKISEAARLEAELAEEGKQEPAAPAAPAKDDSGVILDSMGLQQSYEALANLTHATREALPYLAEIGKQAYNEGVRQFSAWSRRMKELLGDLWERFKSLMQDTWSRVKRIVGNERGAVGRDINRDRELAKRHNDYLDKALEAANRKDEAAALRWIERADEIERMMKPAVGPVIEMGQEVAGETIGDDVARDTIETGAERSEPEVSRVGTNQAVDGSHPQAVQTEIPGSGEGVQRAGVRGDTGTGENTADDEQRTTGIKNAVTEEERETAGKSPVEIETRRSFPDAFDRGKRAVDSGEVDPRLLSKAMAENPRALSAEESVALIYDRMRLQNDHATVMGQIEAAAKADDKVAMAEARQRLAKIEDDINVNDYAARRTGYEQGLGLAARKMMIAEDYSLARSLQRVRVATGLPDVSDELRAKLESLTKQLDEALAASKKYEERIAELEAARKVQRMRDEQPVTRKPRGEKKPERQALDTEFHSLATKFRTLAGRLSMNIDPEMAVVLGEMARNRVIAGVHDARRIIDDIYEDLADIPDLEKRDIRDAISHYGHTYKMSQDEIEVEMREIRRQMRLISALEDAQNKTLPLHSGLQRDPVSDEVRELQKQIKQAMRESGIDSQSARTPEQQWKTSLDAAKTRLRNLIHDLNEQIKTGKKTPKKVGFEYDKEAKALKAEADRLRGILEQIEGKPGISDEQRVKMAMNAVQKSIAEYTRRIKEKDLKPATKASQTPETPELKRLRARRDALAETFKQMQRDARPAKDPQEAALKAYKTRTAKRLADLQEQLDTGNFEKRARRVLKMDPEAMRLKNEVEKAKERIDTEIYKRKLAARTTSERALDWAVKWRRAVILSSVVTLGKLTAAATLRQITTPIEEIIGAGLYRLPVFSRIAAKAPREGAGINVRAEAEAYVQWFKKQTWSDFLDVAKTGRGELDRLYGHKRDLPPEAIEFFGRMHGALKNTPKRAEFFRSLQKITEWHMANGYDMCDPTTQATVAAQAYIEANRAIFMNDNFVVKGYRIMIRYFQSQGVAGQALAAGLQMITPIVKIPTNFAAEVTSLVFGSAKGAARVAFSKGIENLTPEQADYVMRAFKKQGLGVVMLILGYIGAAAGWIGGYYQQGEKRKANDPKPGDLGKVPHWALHTPALEVLQVGATLYRVKAARERWNAENEAKPIDKQKPPKTGGTGAGVFAAGKGILEHIPFIEEPVRMGEAIRTADTAGKWGNEFTESLIIPPDLRRLSKSMDKAGEEQIPREQGTLLDILKGDIPGQRSKLPIDMNRVKRMDISRLADIMEHAPANVTDEIYPEFRKKYVRSAGKLTEDERDRYKQILEDRRP